MLTKKAASYITSTLTPSFRVKAKVALTPSSKDEAALTPFVRDKAYRIVKDALRTPSFRVKGFRSINLLNSTISSIITKLRSIARRVYSGVR